MLVRAAIQRRDDPLTFLHRPLSCTAELPDRFPASGQDDSCGGGSDVARTSLLRRRRRVASIHPSSVPPLRWRRWSSAAESGHARLARHAGSQLGQRFRSSSRSLRRDQCAVEEGLPSVRGRRGCLGRIWCRLRCSRGRCWPRRGLRCRLRRCRCRRRIGHSRREPPARVPW
jgi:hypothetical protein